MSTLRFDWLQVVVKEHKLRSREVGLALDGELITVKACEIPDRNPVNFRIFTQQQDVTALGMTYNGAVTIRWAEYSSVRYPDPLPAGFYHVSDFPMIKSIRDLMLSTASEDL